MMKDEPTTSFGRAAVPYVSGFVISLFLTLEAYVLVAHHELSRKLLIGTVAALALIQFMVQLVLFLHLGRETKPRWKLVVFLFMIMVVFILVFGSIWIMYSLNYRMTPQQIYQYLNNQGDGI